MVKGFLVYIEREGGEEEEFLKEDTFAKIVQNSVPNGSIIMMQPLGILYYMQKNVKHVRNV